MEASAACRLGLHREHILAPKKRRSSNLTHTTEQILERDGQLRGLGGGGEDKAVGVSHHLNVEGRDDERGQLITNPPTPFLTVFQVASQRRGGRQPPQASW